MKGSKVKYIVSATLSAMAVAFAPSALAVDGDDGVLLRVNVSRTPDVPTEFANVQMAKFYVPAWNSQTNQATTISYTTNPSLPDENFTRTQAKPLVAAMNDGPVEDVIWTNPVTGVEYEPAFPGHGKRDAFSRISYDDGSTWRMRNVSESGSQVVGPIFVVDHSGKYVCDTTGLEPSAVSKLEKSPTKERCDYFYYGDNPLETPDPTPNDMVNGVKVIDTLHLVEENIYGGGDVPLVGQAVVGNNILVAWVSRQCSGGASPLNSIPTGANPYGVLGIQSYVDYALLKAEGEIGTSALNAIHEIGKVPFSCLWTRRGQIRVADGVPAVTWFPAERLTSGVRDAWKLEVAGQENAGFAVTWQEDPEGLKSGSGEGPGEGWSGSTVAHKTDVWYSYVHLDNFTNLAPVMSLPVPITDNAKCPISSGDQAKQWCYADNGTYIPTTFNSDGSVNVAGYWDPTPNLLPDYCADGDLVYNSCIAEDGRYMEGQTGASRPRLNIQSYCKDNDDVNTWGSCTTGWSGWAAIAYEESKGKGDLVNEDGVTLENGKNQRYHTFEFTKPETIKQGLLLNAPARRYPGFKLESSVYDTSVPGFHPDLVNPVQEVYDDLIVYRPNIFGNAIWSAPYFDTEIARRASITSQGVKAAVNSNAKTSILTIFKQGLINQGGPADIMFRRFEAKDLKDGEFNPGSDNPFATMACDRWATQDELGKINNPDLFTLNGLPNPNYLDGLCLAPAHNVSGTTPTTCDGVAIADPSGAACGYGNTNPFIYRPGAEVKRVFTWAQTQGADSTAFVDNRDDESWTNPWDVAKGHRGILDGDHIMLQYAWAPNEVANAVGRDKYDLYIRRSFDGGQTWTTTPNAAPWTDVAGVVADGATWCETYRSPVVPIPADSTPGVAFTLPVCTNIGAGLPEPGRNISLIASKVTTLTYPAATADMLNYPSRTVLDPRYTPTGGLLKHASTAFVLVGNIVQPQTAYEDQPGFTGQGGDKRNPSKFFIAYDDGDNTTVAGGAEAEPVNMFYGQAYNWGDEYTGLPVSWATTPITTVNRLQALNLTGTNASESSITASPDGSFLYSIWNQWQWSIPFDYDSEEINEDAWFRRVMFIDGQ